VILKSKNNTIKIIDGIATVVRKKRKLGEFQIYQGKIFNNNEKCFVAERGEVFAHAQTSKQAVEDANFKYLSHNYDISYVTEEINKTKTMSVSQFRLITGACKMGCDNFLKNKNIQETILPLEKALVLIKDQYGWDRIKELLLTN